MIKSPSKPETLLGLMDSLSDATRLRLLRLLERHELGVAELCDILQLPQSTVSRHLKVLSDQGWVRPRRQGTTHLYRMTLDELNGPEPASPPRRLWLLTREQTDDWAAVHQDELRLAQRLSDRQRESEAFFAGAASEWDRLRGELYGDAFTTAALLSLLPPDYIVADLGCGTGTVADQLADHVAKVIAVDNSAAMLKAAKRRIADRDNVDLRRGDLASLPIDDATCDAALLLLALTYVDDPATVLKEMHRILKPGGRGVIVDLLPHDRDDFRHEMGQRFMGFGGDEVTAMLITAGFVSSNVQPLPPEANARGPALFLAAAMRARDANFKQ